MGHPAMGILSLVVAGAFLVWVYEKTGNPVQKIGKFIGWLGVVIAILLLIGQMFVCGSMCLSGQCMRTMKGQGMMMPGMMQHPSMERPMMMPPMQPPMKHHEEKPGE